MIVNNGISAYKDAIKPLIANMKTGTGTTPTSITDNDLETPVLTKAATNLDGNAIGKVVRRMRVLSSEANGNDLTEVGWFLNGNMAGRLTHPAVSKTSSFELLYEVTEEVQNI